jgi:hypothetical protein
MFLGQAIYVLGPLQLAADRNRTVIVLDQFEQLSFDTLTHQPLFEALKGLYAQTLENSVKVDFRLPQSGAALVC